MTQRQLAKKVKSLVFRRKLCDTIAGLEEGIKAYMTVEQKRSLAVANFLVWLDEDGNLWVTERPTTDPNQMEIEFESKEVV